VNGRVITQESLAYETTTSSMRIDAQAVSAAFCWLEKSNFTHMLFITDLLSMLPKIEAGMFRIDWLGSLNRSQVMGIKLVYYPGYAGVHGNEQADEIAGMVPVGKQLLYDRNDALWDKVCSESDETENAYVDRMRLLGVMRGSGGHSTLQGNVRRSYNQLTIGSISITKLRWHLKGGTELVWVCPKFNGFDS